MSAPVYAVRNAFLCCPLSLPRQLSLYRPLVPPLTPCSYTGTLTDRKAAQLDDLKSFAGHLGQRMDEEAGLGAFKSCLVVVRRGALVCWM